MKRPQAKALLLAALIVLTFTLPTSAALDISRSSEPPSGVFLLGYGGAAGGSIQLSHGSSEETGIGQTFLLTSPGTLDRVTLLFTPESEVAGDGVELWLGPVSETNEIEDPLQVEVGLLPSDLEVGETVYLTLDLTDLALEADVQYALLLFFRGGGLVNSSRADVHHLGEDAYLEGQSLEWAPAGTTAWDDDLIFYLSDAAAIFGDGFESGDTDAWSVTVP